MTVEEIIRNFEGEDRNYDNFPVGMRVLAVDDDPICLKLLEGLLRKCQYQVTTTSQAIMALKMLRENRDRFDLVISDVHMPDMDGFKLLELVGLEMDLPVIMLSANSDTKLVMKGITHGACDYLVKPVRIEELRNIWQHVLRRKKVDSKSQSKSDDQGKGHGNGEGGQGDLQMGNVDQNGKVNKKRKDDDDDDGEENSNENDDPSSQKKPRVVWSIELHRKFVAAVNQLGIERAVPKRILDLMNVDGLTRENVASHLQKYRLYLKRISSVASQQANMVAAWGGKDFAYMRKSQLDGLGDFRALAGSGRLVNPAFSAYPQGGILGRLNSPAGGIGIGNLTSSALMQPSHMQNLSNPISTLGKLHSTPTSQNPSLFQGVPSSLELDQLQPNKCTTRVGDFNPLNDSRVFTSDCAFTDSRNTAINSNSTLTVAPSSMNILQGNPQQAGATAGFLDQSSINLSSFNSEPLNIDVGGSTNFLDHGRCNESWQSAVQLSKFHPNSLQPTESFSRGQLLLTSDIDRNSSAGSHLQSSPLEFPSMAAISASLEVSRGGIRGQESMVGSIVQNINQGPQQHWAETRQIYSDNSNSILGTMNSNIPANGAGNPLMQSIRENGISDRRMDICITGHSSASGSAFLQHTGIEKPTAGSRTRSTEDYILEQTKARGGLVQHGYDLLDDFLMNSMIKREEDGNVFGGDVGFDGYPFGSCL